MIFQSSKSWCARALLASLAVVAIEAPAFAANLKNVCASYLAAERAIQFDVSNGCVSGSYKYLGHDIKVDVDENYASISLKGRFKYAPLKADYVTADCGGGRKLKLKSHGVAARRYTVVVNGTYRGVLDFTQSKDRMCVRPASSKNGVRKVSPISSRTELKRTLDTVEGPTIQKVLEPLMHSLSVSSEGRGTLALQIEKTFSGPDAPRTANAIIEAHGLADDSVSGLHYTFDFVSTSKGWKAMGVRRKQMCARGETAGMWTSGRCS